MIVVANIPFKDKEEGALREKGERFSCNDERGKYLVSCGIVEAVKGSPEQPTTPTEKATAKKPARKATKK